MRPVIIFILFTVGAVIAKGGCLEGKCDFCVESSTN